MFQGRVRPDCKRLIVAAHAATTPGHQATPGPQHRAEEETPDGGGLEVVRGRGARRAPPVTEDGVQDTGVIHLGYIPKFHPKHKAKS